MKALDSYYGNASLLEHFKSIKGTRLAEILKHSYLRWYQQNYIVLVYLVIMKYYNLLSTSSWLIEEFVIR